MPECRAAAGTRVKTTRVIFYYPTGTRVVKMKKIVKFEFSIYG